MLLQHPSGADILTYNFLSPFATRHRAIDFSGNFFSYTAQNNITKGNQLIAYTVQHNI
jgi:hypothetical protein